MQHTPEFEALVSAVRPTVKEVTLEQAKAILTKNSDARMIDVREESEWESGHAQSAVHLGRGVIERDIVGLYPDKNRELILYCGGGYRSILAADNLQKMGYQKVSSLIGGFKTLVSAGYPIHK